MLHHTEMQRTLKDLLEQQGRAGGSKNFPYPRQYATIDTIFVWSFAGSAAVLARQGIRPSKRSVTG